MAIEKPYDIADKFKLIRTRERLTQKEMADALEMSLGSYKNYEQGSRRGISIIEIIRIFKYERFSKYLLWFMTDETTICEQVSPE